MTVFSLISEDWSELETSFDINVSNEKLQSNIYNRAIFVKIINGLTIFANNFIVDVRLGSK